jgi:hypothetical protein
VRIGRARYFSVSGPSAGSSIQKWGTGRQAEGVTDVDGEARSTLDELLIETSGKRDLLELLRDVQKSVAPPNPPPPLDDTAED